MRDRRGGARPIELEHSTITVHVFKAGLFSAFADDHVIRAPIADGRVTEEGALAVEVIAHAAQMSTRMARTNGA